MTKYKEALAENVGISLTKGHSDKRQDPSICRFKPWKGLQNNLRQTDGLSHQS